MNWLFIDDTHTQCCVIQTHAQKKRNSFDSSLNSFILTRKSTTKTLEFFFLFIYFHFMNIIPNEYNFFFACFGNVIVRIYLIEIDHHNYPLVSILKQFRPSSDGNREFLILNNFFLFFFFDIFHH